MQSGAVVSASAELKEDKDIDLFWVFSRLWARKWWVVGSVMLFAVAFVASTFLMTPKYRAKTVLIPTSMEQSGMGLLASALGQLGGLASLAGINLGGGDTQMEEALAVLGSREFTESFIRDKNLMPILFERRWDKEKQQWRGSRQKWPTISSAYKFFNRKVKRVSRDSKTGLVTLEIEWKDPVLAAEWANELVERLNAEMRARAIERTNASVGYLQKELEATTAVDTRASINRLMESQLNQRMFANVTKEYAFRVVDRALPPDLQDKVWPRRGLMLILGGIVGFVVGAGAVFTAHALRRSAATDR